MIFIEGEVPWIGSVGKKRAGCLHLPAGTRHTKGKTLFPKQKPPGGCEEAQHEHTAHQVQFCWAPSHPRGNRAVRTPLCWAYPMQGWGQAPHQPWLSPISWYQPRGLPRITGQGEACRQPAPGAAAGMLLSSVVQNAPSHQCSKCFCRGRWGAGVFLATVCFVYTRWTNEYFRWYRKPKLCLGKSRKNKAKWLTSSRLMQKYS